MSLDLDERQRAMLEEMGVRVFWPDVPPEEAVVIAGAPAGSAARAPVQLQEPTHARAAAPVSSPPTAIDGLSWEELEQAVAAGRQGSVFGGGDRQAHCLVVGDGPGEDEEGQGQAFVGDAGVLLDNMLASLALTRKRGAYLTHLVKWRGSPTAGDLAWCEAVLRRQVQLVQPKVILVMGRLAVQTLLRTGEPPGRLRGRAHDYAGVPLVVTYPVVSLLRQPADKGKAWADLCVAQAVMRQA